MSQIRMPHVVCHIIEAMSHGSQDAKKLGSSYRLVDWLSIFLLSLKIPA